MPVTRASSVLVEFNAGANHGTDIDGLTDATGEKVLCICILATKSLSVTDVKGFDYRASIPYDSSKTMEKNMGEGKALPGLPV